MPFNLIYLDQALADLARIELAARSAMANRAAKAKSKSSKQEGLLKQVIGALEKLSANPKYPGLNSHPYKSKVHPTNPKEPIWESYVQNHAPSAYRIFWVYGPETDEITILEITQHP